MTPHEERQPSWTLYGIALCFLLTFALVIVFGVLAPGAQAGSSAGTLAASRDLALPAGSPFASPLGNWRSGGPYGGNVRALALSPDFRTDGFALAGGWREGHYGVTGGYGIVRTTDGGASWQMLQDEQHHWPVFDLAVSPAFATDRTAFAGTDVGLLRSTDRGVTWTWLYNGLPSPAHGSPGLDDIARIRISPAYASDQTVFAVQRGAPSYESNLYRTTDRGDSWTAVLNGIVTTAALSRDYGANRTVFASDFDGVTTTDLRRSTDAGQTWETVYRLNSQQVNDMVELYGGALLLATGNGIVRLVPDATGYAPDPPTANIATTVNRLAVAGDHIYAAAADGLYISLSEGRTWQRYDDTPAEPFRAVAPCPLWGACHALMAGTDTGILFTQDDNLEPWRWLPGPTVLRAESVAASPSYAVDGTLFAGTDGGLYRSSDRGFSWQRVTAGSPVGADASFRAVRVSPAYATDGTVFASYENRSLVETALYRSTDRGNTWTIFAAAAGTAALAISPAYATDHTVFYGRGDRVYKSTDGGMGWVSYPVDPALDPLLKIAVSPNYASDKTLYATGYGGVRRSTDGGMTWAAMPTYGPAYDIAISPGYAADGAAWHTFRAIEAPGDGTPESAVVRSTDRGATWSFATAGLPGVYEPFPYAIAASPRYTSDKTLFAALHGQFVAGNSHSLYRGLDGGAWWNEVGPAPGNPDVFELALTSYGPNALTAHLATAAGVWHYESACEERITNGGFETPDVGWQTPATPATAVFDTKYAHSGQASLRTGIDGGANVYSYSSANQYINIPAGAASSVLTLWIYPISGEGPLAADAAAPTPAELAAAAAASVGAAQPAAAPAATDSADRQYVLLLDTAGNVLKSLLWMRSDARAWQPLTFDLTAYRGRNLRIAVGTYNDGNDGATAMYVDDVSLVVCWPAVNGPTPTPTATRALTGRVYLPILLHKWGAPEQPTNTPTATSTGTMTPTPTSTPTATVPPPTVAPSVCYVGLLNGGFETNAAWIIRSNPVLAGYVTTPVHGGSRSMRTGIPAGGSNVTSYSPIEQAATFPGLLVSARLTFWRYNVYGDPVAAGGGAPDVARLPRTEAELNAALAGASSLGPDATDFFYVIGILPDGSIDWIFTESVNNPAWREKTVDVSRFRGKQIRFQFGTYNNGNSGISRTFVDDVALDVCPLAGALVLPAGWPDRVVGRAELSTLYAALGGDLYRSADAGLAWALVGTARPERMLLSGQPDMLYAGDGRSCYDGGAAAPAYRSTDAGATWQTLPAAADLPPLAAHASLPWLYLGGCGGPYLSKDGGNAVTQQTAPIFSLYDVARVAPVGASTGAGWQTVWAGGVSEGGNGAVVVSRDGGSTWSQSTPPELDMGWFGALAVDRFASNTIYTAVARGFFYSADDGQHWQMNNAGLADALDPGTGGRPIGLLSLAQSAAGQPFRLYLGTVRGLYTTAALNAPWQKVTGVPFESLEVSALLLLDAAPDRLYVTTPAGVFVYNLGGSPAPASPTPTATATPTSTPTSTPATSSIPTAAPGAWPTPFVLGSQSFPAGSHPHGLAVSPAGDRLFVTYHGANHSGNKLAFLKTVPPALDGEMALDTRPAGPNQAAIVSFTAAPWGYLVAVTGRETGELVLVEPSARTIYRRLDVGDQPDGVISQGDAIYVANWANDTVSMFDANTLDSRGVLGVGHEPALFAGDPETGAVFLSLHGGNKVARILGSGVTDEYLEIPEPYSLAFDPTDRRLYVGSRGLHHKVTVVDVASGKTLGAINVGGEAFLVAVNPDTGHLFVSLGDRLEVYSTLDWQRVATLPLPASGEEGIAVDSVYDRVYIASGGSDAVTVIQDATAALVLFFSDRDGNGELYRMLPDGREQVRLTYSGSASETAAAGSPDGRWIAYARDDGSGLRLWRMSRNGRNAQPLNSGGPNDNDPTWSPDGRYLVFASNRGGNDDVYRLQLVDGAVTRLMTDAKQDLDPDWSWAMNRIAFASNRNGSNMELFTMAPDGSDVQQLTVNPNGDSAPSWGPTGARLVFWATRGEQTLYRMNCDGTGIVPLVSRLLRPVGPQWGPGSAGGWIVFTGYRPGSGYSEVLRTGEDGSGTVLLTNNELNFDTATGWLPGVQ
jgi:photosystem II stability/assembly factor-like uncharacterized protein/WD40 repeat protein